VTWEPKCSIFLGETSAKEAMERTEMLAVRGGWREGRPFIREDAEVKGKEAIEKKNGGVECFE